MMPRPVDRVGTWPSMCRHPRVPWRWVVVAAAFLTFTVLFGILNSYNVLFVAFQEEFESSATMTGWIGSVALGLTMLIAPLVNVLTERFGYRPVSVAGIMTSAGALIVTSFLPNILAVFLSYGVMVGIGGGLVTVSSIDVVMLYFPEQNSVRAMALIMVGPGLGVVTLAPLMSLIITRHGWRVLLRIMGSLLFLVGLPCVLTFADPPNSSHQPDDDKNKYQDLQPVTDALEDAKNCTCKEAQVYHCDKAAVWTPNVGLLTKLGNNNLVEDKKTYHQAKTSSDHRRGSCAKCTTLNDEQGYQRSFDREMPCDGDPCLNGELRCDVVKHCETLKPQKGKCSDHGMVWKILVALTFPEIWLLSISTVLNGIGDSFYFVNLINYMLSVGFQKEFGVKVVTVLGFANLVGRMMMSLGGDYVPFPRVFLLAISSLVGIGVMLLIMFTRNHIIMYIIAAVIGSVMMSTTNIITFMIPAEFFGPERALETSSVMIFMYGLGFVLGSVMGQSIDNTGSYASAIRAFVGMYIVSGLCVLMAPVYQRFFAPQRFITFELFRKKREARKKNKIEMEKETDSENTLNSKATVHERVTCV